MLIAYMGGSALDRLRKRLTAWLLCFFRVRWPVRRWLRYPLNFMVMQLALYIIRDICPSRHTQQLPRGCKTLRVQTASDLVRDWRKCTVSAVLNNDIRKLPKRIIRAFPAIAVLFFQEHLRDGNVFDSMCYLAGVSACGCLRDAFPVVRYVPILAAGMSAYVCAHLRSNTLHLVDGNHQHTPELFRIVGGDAPHLPPDSPPKMNGEMVTKCTNQEEMLMLILRLVVEAMDRVRQDPSVGNRVSVVIKGGAALALRFLHALGALAHLVSPLYTGGDVDLVLTFAPNVTEHEKRCIQRKLLKECAMLFQTSYKDQFYDLMQFELDQTFGLKRYQIRQLDVSTTGVQVKEPTPLPENPWIVAVNEWEDPLPSPVSGMTTTHNFVKYAYAEGSLKQREGLSVDFLLSRLKYKCELEDRQDPQRRYVVHGECVDIVVDLLHDTSSRHVCCDS